MAVSIIFAKWSWSVEVPLLDLSGDPALEVVTDAPMPLAFESIITSARSLQCAPVHHASQASNSLKVRALESRRPMLVESSSDYSSREHLLIDFGPAVGSFR